MTKSLIRIGEFKDQKGYLAIVQNGQVDYLRLAYLQALSIKTTQRKYSSYAIMVDAETKKKITKDHLEVIDYVIDIPWGDDAVGQQWKLANEWKVWSATPFNETIKLDVDLIFTASVDHWWQMMGITDLCLCTTVRDREGEIVTESPYRHMSKINYLPEVYSAFSYFRDSPTTVKFFSYCRDIFSNWEIFRDRILKDCQEKTPTTDTVYSIAAILVGVEKCLLPKSTVPSFVHMKGGIQGWPLSQDWTQCLHSQINDYGNFSIGTIKQSYPVHYHIKNFATDEIINHYKKIFNDLQS